MSLSPPNLPHPAGDDGAAREILLALRGALLRLHKSLLEMERRTYERNYGLVNAGELFRLVVDNPQFAWLHNLSEFVVRIDETLTSEAPVTSTDAALAVDLARKMFIPTASGDAFQRKYFDAIQNDSAVVMEHAVLARLFASMPADHPADD